MHNQSEGVILTPFSAPLELPSTSDIPSWFTIAFAAINGGGFCLNTLSLWLLATRKFVYRSKVNTFIVSLCVSDFLVSLSGFYFLGTINSSSISQFSRRVATIIFGFSLETSLMSLCNLSYERLTAIRKPFKYTEILSTKKIACITIFGWTFCLSLLAVQFAFGFIYRHHHYVYFNWIVFISLALVSMSFLGIVYIYLILEIKRHSSHIRTHSVPSKDNKSTSKYDHGSDFSKDASDQLTEVTYTSSSSASTRVVEKHNEYVSQMYKNTQKETSKSSSRNENRDLLKSALVRARNVKRPSERRRLSTRGQLIRKERRSVMFCLSIVVLFVATWLPVIVFFVRCLFHNTCEQDDQLLFICSCLVSLNSLLDPVLYFIITKDFRNFLCGKVCRSQSRRGSYESRRGSSGNFL